MKNIIKKLTLFLVTIFIMLILSEIIIRISNIVNVFIPTKNLYRNSANKNIGYELVPGFTGEVNGVNVSINSDGLRDRDYSIDKPDNTFRIWVAGDSLTFGYGVKQNKIFPEILETKLNSDPEFSQKHNFEVINGGVSGYNTKQELETFKVKGRKYKPDLCILVLVSNDFRNNIEFFIDLDGYLSFSRPKNRFHRYLRSIKKNNHLLTLLAVEKVKF